MDTDFGAGARFGMAEENIFLFDALKKGLHIYYVPVRIAELTETESTWFKGYTEEFFRNRGAGYLRMAGLAAGVILCLQYAVRKYKLYKSSCGFFNALRNMLMGMEAYGKTRSVYYRG